MAQLIECDNCGAEYPPVVCRWRCPACGLKSSHCEGEAQPFKQGWDADGNYVLE